MSQDNLTLGIETSEEYVGNDLHHSYPNWSCNSWKDSGQPDKIEPEMCYYAGISIELLLELLQEAGYSSYEQVSALQSPPFPVLTMDLPRHFQPMHWLFTPPWLTSSEQLKGRKIWAANVRIEDAEMKKLYAPATAKKRCVAVFSHFFEWRREGKKKIKYKIGLRDEAPLFLPGLYSEALIDGKPWLSFGVCTMEAQNIMRYIHNTTLRQPVVVDSDTADVWLNPKISFDEARKAVLQKERSGEFVSDPPVQSSEPSQMTLFSEETIV